jgi:hypothetical protein
VGGGPSAKDDLETMRVSALLRAYTEADVALLSTAESGVQRALLADHKVGVRPSSPEPSLISFRSLF